MESCRADCKCFGETATGLDDWGLFPLVTFCLGAAIGPYICSEIPKLRSRALSTLQSIVVGVQTTSVKIQQHVKESRRRATAVQQGDQAVYEEAHRAVTQGNMGGTCKTLMHGPCSPGACSKCGRWHFWFCHQCRTRQYWGSCVNGCDWSSFGWSCLDSQCKGAHCGCTLGRNHWKENGRVA